MYMTKLSSIADYVTDKISSNDIALREYVTTDCILQNKKGREIATNLPPQSCCLTRYQHGDVLIANIRPYLKKVWFADIDGGASSDVLVFRVKEGHSPSFLYAVLLQDSFFDYVMQGAKGSKMPRGDKEQILRYEMPTLSCSEESIGTFFLNLDKKIRLNEQINQNLEAMVKQLYDYWFVQFDFPNENGKPYKSSGGKMVWNEKLHLSIPSNWEAIPLSEIMDYAGGSQPPASEFIEEYRDGYVRFVQIRDYYSNSHITYIPIRKSNKLCTETDIMIARYGASLGRICYGLNGAYNVALAKVSPKVKEYTEYLRIFLMSDGFYNKINSIGQRAAQAGFNKDDIENILIPFPTNNRCIIEFNKKMQPYFFARLQNDKEINTLTKQRDELLPLLMNGQVSVNSDLSND